MSVLQAIKRAWRDTAPVKPREVRDQWQPTTPEGKWIAATLAESAHRKDVYVETVTDGESVICYRLYAPKCILESAPSALDNNYGGVRVPVAILRRLVANGWCHWAVLKYDGSGDWEEAETGEQKWWLDKEVLVHVDSSLPRSQRIWA